MYIICNFHQVQFKFNYDTNYYKIYDKKINFRYGDGR